MVEYVKYIYVYLYIAKICINQSILPDHQASPPFRLSRWLFLKVNLLEIELKASRDFRCVDARRRTGGGANFNKGLFSIIYQVYPVI